MDQIDSLQRNCEEAVSATPGYTAGDICSVIPDYISQVSGEVLVYDTRIFEYDWDPIEEQYENYLNTNALKDKLYQAIHVDSSPKDPKYDSFSQAAYDAYEPEETNDYTNKVTFIIENNIPVLIYAGEYDVLDGPRTIEDWLKNIG